MWPEQKGSSETACWLEGRVNEGVSLAFHPPPLSAGPAQGHHLPASTPCPPGPGLHLDDGLPSVLLPGLAHTLMDGALCAVSDPLSDRLPAMERGS